MDVRLGRSIVVSDFTREMEAKFAPALAGAGFTIKMASGSKELRPSGEHNPDLLIALLKPGTNRFRRLRRLLAEWAVPVVVLAHRPHHVDATVALDLGADEYLPSDCEAGELIACLHALLRRRQGSYLADDRPVG